MTLIEHFGILALAQGERRGWSPTAKIILAFILALLVLSPALLGLYWEMILPKG